jgi:hypothetical protein
MAFDHHAPAGARPRLPPLNALRSFEAVARHGSFAAAAAELSVTHWAVGKQIRLLEDWFGLPLFERRPRGVQLTDEGAALLGDVGAAFDRLGATAARLRQEGLPRRVPASCGPSPWPAWRSADDPAPGRLPGPLPRHRAAAQHRLAQAALCGRGL